ncbi:hypothetical protein FOCC_FOCC000961 [Frankliniella occidentalis]|nr:hypothetical protein FOCC_FOCC000961 [Frankliniella occidentalis]
MKMRVITVLRDKIRQCNLDPSYFTKRGQLLRKAFGKHLLLTNTLSSGFLMGLGDYCQQRIEIFQGKSSDNAVDKRRTINMSTVGLAHGIYHHFFYGWMDKRFPGRAVRQVMFKVLLDQLMASPACMYIFFIGMGLLERRGYESGWQEMKKKFLFCYTVDWIVWPPNQFINFYYVPAKYRVIYINSLTMLYDVFLSYVKFYAAFKEKKKNLFFHLQNKKKT